MGVCMSHEQQIRQIMAEPEYVPAEYKAYKPPPLEVKHKMYDYDEVRHDPETVAIFLCPHSVGYGPDKMVMVDLNQDSPTYSTIISELDFPSIGDEACKMNWIRSATNLDEMRSVVRSHIVVPCMSSNRIYVVAVEEGSLKIVKMLDSDVLERRDLSCPYAVHTLPISGAPIHVSTLGCLDGHGKGDFVLLDRKTFEIRERSNKREFASFGGEFSMQTRHNILISSEWGHPRLFKNGFILGDIENDDVNASPIIDPNSHGADARTLTNLSVHWQPKACYGCSLNVWQISPGMLKQTLELDPFDGCMTTAVRFLHNPECNHAFACSAIGSSIFHVHMDSLSGEFRADKVVQLPSVRVRNWLCDDMPAMFTDLVISMDDRFLYVAAWLHGIILQYDISDPFKVSLCGKVYIGGLLCANSDVEVINRENNNVHEETIVQDRIFRGGPATMQLSLDGKRLYVTNSYYKPWDAQFYPDLISHGGQVIKVDVNVRNGGLDVNPDFMIDLKELDGGPYVARDIHFTTGDCTSDNFL